MLRGLNSEELFDRLCEADRAHKYSRTAGSKWAKEDEDVLRRDFDNLSCKHPCYAMHPRHRGLGLRQFGVMEAAGCRQG